MAGRVEGDGPVVLRLAAGPASVYFSPAENVYCSGVTAWYGMPAG